MCAATEATPDHGGDAFLKNKTNWERAKALNDVIHHTLESSSDILLCDTSHGSIMSSHPTVYGTISRQVDIGCIKEPADMSQRVGQYAAFLPSL